MPELPRNPSAQIFLEVSQPLVFHFCTVSGIVQCAGLRPSVRKDEGEGDAMRRVFHSLFAWPMFDMIRILYVPFVIRYSCMLSCRSFFVRNILYRLYSITLLHWALLLRLYNHVYIVVQAHVDIC